MRRVPVVVVAGLALTLMAACGGDDEDGDNGTAAPPPPATSAAPPAGGGSGSDEATCVAGEELMTSLATDSLAAQEAMLDAAESGDLAEIQAATEEYADFLRGFTTDVREVAATAEDPGLQSALETVADEFDTMADQIENDPAGMADLDTTALDDAAAEVAAYCG